MNIVAVYGTMRRETTWQITNLFLRLLAKPEDHITRLFLPRDMPRFCAGCGACFSDERQCPNREYVAPIKEALERADVIVLASPVYVMHASGQMKVFLDHFAHQFMIHRPLPELFRTQGLVITQGAGAGMGSAAKDMLDSLLYWGVGRRYAFKTNVLAANWAGVSHEKKRRIVRELKTIAAEIRADENDVYADAKVRSLFEAHRLMHKMMQLNEPDTAHWRKHGWLDGKRPWRKYERHQATANEK